MTDSKKKFDALQMYFGEPYQLSDKIMIYQPSIGDILKMGEKDFYSSLYVFIGNPTTFRLQLWKMGHDWNKVSDFELFRSLVTNIKKDFTSLLFGDIDFASFKSLKLKKDGEEKIVLFSPTLETIIDEDMFFTMRDYLQQMFRIAPKVEKAKGKTTKEWIIEEEEKKLKKAAAQQKEESILIPLVSSCINHPGFKYKLHELKEVGICEFMDSVSRLQVYESSTALLKGAYSGFIDTSKIDKESFNFMREI